MSTKRKPLTKTIRFEVFKRDSFRCQYCGSEAPNVLLHVDHIEPVAKGGTNDITNLITACEGCNAGKRDRRLSDHAAVKKSRTQLDELQARREQLELMMEWRKGLRSIADETVSSLAEYWNHYTPGLTLSEIGMKDLSELVGNFSVEEICAAMDVSARSNLEFNDDGTTTASSFEAAWTKLAGICRVSRACKDDPDLKRLLYIRAILRNRITGYFDNPKALQLLKIARSWDVSLDDLHGIALAARNWSGFRRMIDEAIEDAPA